VTVRLGGSAELCNGLSRMSGNHQVRFLGEDAAARPHPYPTDDAGGVQKDGTFKDLSWMHQHGTQCSHRHMIQSDGRLFGVETKRVKMFAILASKEVFEVAVDILRGVISALAEELTGGLFDETNAVTRNRIGSKFGFGGGTVHGHSFSASFGCEWSDWAIGLCVPITHATMCQLLSSEQVKPLSDNIDSQENEPRAEREDKGKANPTTQ